MRTKTFFTYPVILLPFLLMITWSCNKKQAEYQSMMPREIRIGALLAMTGTGASTGESSVVAIELARQQVEAHLQALGYPVAVRLIVEDSQTDTAVALQKLQTLYLEGIRLVIGPYSSSEVAHLKEFADRNGVLLVSPSSVATSLALPDDNIFRFVSSDKIQAEAMTKMLTEDQIRMVVPIIRDDVWGNDLLQALIEDVQHAGGVVHDPVKYLPETVDFTDLLLQLEGNVTTALSQYDTNQVGVYLASFGEGTLILKGAGNLDPGNLSAVAWYGSSAFAQNGTAIGDPEAAWFALGHGLPCPIYGLDESARFKWQPVSDQIAHVIGRSPEVYALTAYDALWVAATTFLTVEPGDDIERVKQIFTSVADSYFGVTGNTTLDRNGDRAFGNYDFWAVNYFTNDFIWQRVAVYNSATGILTRY